MRRFFKRLFSLLFLLAIAAVCYHYRGWFMEQYRHAQGMYYIYKGDQAYAKDNMGKTIKLYTKGLELYPQHYEAWYNLGNIYTVHEDYFAAVEAYENAIKYHPKYVLARMNLGIVYSEDLGFFDEAIKQFDIITQLKIFKLWIPWVYSNVKSVKTNRGLAYFNKGVALRQKAIYLPIEQHYLADQYLREAIEAYTKALKFLKKNYDVYYNRAVIHHIRGQYRDAGLDYCKAIEISPMNFEAHYNLAVLLRGLNRDRDAITELEKAAILISTKPDSSSLQTAYIFNLLNEVTRRLITTEEYYTDKLSDVPTVATSYTYVNGRMVPDADLDSAMDSNFKSCTGFEFFKNYEEDEE